MLLGLWAWWRDSPNSRRASVSLSALVGVILLEARDPAVRSITKSVAERVDEYLTDSRQLSQLPATLALVGFGLLRDRGIQIPALTAFVDLLCSLAGPLPPDEATAMAWCEKRVVLAQLGLISQPTLPELSTLWVVLDQASEGELTQVWQHAGACTGYGCLPPLNLSRTDRIGVRRLEALAVDAFRRRDLITGCALARAVNALTPLDAERLDSFTSYLHSHQHPAGGYGYVEEAPERAIDPELDVRLPTSLAVCWTLAEITTNFRLFTYINNANDYESSRTS